MRRENKLFNFVAVANTVHARRVARFTLEHSRTAFLALIRKINVCIRMAELLVAKETDSIKSFFVYPKRQVACPNSPYSHSHISKCDSHMYSKSDSVHM